MQGLWKENISGYNHKGYKRKKWTRKHTVKNKIKVFKKTGIHKIYRKNIENVYWEEPLIEYTTTKINKEINYGDLYYGTISVWKGSFRNWNDQWYESKYSFENVLIVKYGKDYYKTDENFEHYTYLSEYTENDKKNLKKSQLKYAGSITFDKENFQKEEVKTIISTPMNSKEFIYGKLLGFVPHWYKYDRKGYLKIARNIQKQKIKQWIYNEEWEEKSFPLLHFKSMADKNYEWWY